MASGGAQLQDPLFQRSITMFSPLPQRILDPPLRYIVISLLQQLSYRHNNCDSSWYRSGFFETSAFLVVIPKLVATSSLLWLSLYVASLNDITTSSLHTYTHTQL